MHLHLQMYIYDGPLRDASALQDIQDFVRSGYESAVRPQSAILGMPEREGANGGWEREGGGRDFGVGVGVCVPPRLGRDAGREAANEVQLPRLRGACSRCCGPGASVEACSCATAAAGLPVLTSLLTLVWSPPCSFACPHV